MQVALILVWNGTKFTFQLNPDKIVIAAEQSFADCALLIDEK
jgi:hypothetical protein